MTNIIIMGAAGRDFHDFNVVFRERTEDRVVAFTAAQIPNISGRTYPPELAGGRYPDGVSIYPEEELQRLILELNVQRVIFAYSDIAHVDLMHKASLVLAAGASFEMLGPDQTMLVSRRPVLSVCAVRTGAGKSPLVRAAVRVLRESGKTACVVRHPMPYGDLRQQIAQRFATLDDLDTQHCTIEEREEYEPHVRAGTVVFAGVDYARILALAEAEAEIIVWDGGNNDLPFFRPSLHIVVADARRPGHELLYHPGEANARMADAFVITKVDQVPPENIASIRTNLATLNARAEVTEARFQLTIDQPQSLAGQKVLIIEDGPTITHGGMADGAGLRFATAAGAEPVDPRQWAVGSIRTAYEEYPHIGPVLPALGYGDDQLAELETTINAVPCDVVVVASPVDIRRLIDLRHPSVRVTYEFEAVSGPSLDEILAPLIRGSAV
jgi:predicted GTPase